MRVVITGATGYIGNKLVQRLNRDGHEICAIIRESSNVETIIDYTECLVKMENREEVYKEMARFRPEMYINLAGYYCGSHTMNQISELIESNIMLETYVLDAAVQAGECKYVLHTASVQQMVDGKSYSPLNLYAATKQAFENILYYYYESKGLSVLTLQLFDTYGEDDKRRKVFNLVRALEEGKRLHMSPGEQKMYFCHITDVIEAYTSAMKYLCSLEENVFVKFAIRDEKPIVLKEFVEMYLKFLGREDAVIWGGRPYMANEIMDPTGYGEVLPGWQPVMSYQEGVCRCAEYDCNRRRNEKA